MHIHTQGIVRRNEPRHALGLTRIDQDLLRVYHEVVGPEIGAYDGRAAADGFADLCGVISIGFEHGDTGVGA